MCGYEYECGSNTVLDKGLRYLTDTTDVSTVEKNTYCP